jgi:hypothetical protein
MQSVLSQSSDLGFSRAARKLGRLEFVPLSVWIEVHTPPDQAIKNYQNQLTGCILDGVASYRWTDPVSSSRAEGLCAGESRDRW